MTQPLPEAGPSQSDLPPRSRLLTNLTTQSSLLTQLFTQISQPQQSAQPSLSNPTASTYTSLENSVDELGAIVKDLKTHHAAWARLEERRKEVKILEMEVRRVIGELESGRRELEGMVKQGREVREAIDKGSKEPFAVQPLLAHARSLAKHSSAPLSSLIAPIDKAQCQPWPTETAMRSGILFKEGGSMSGIGEMGVVGEESARATQPVEDFHPQEERRRPAPAVFSLDLNSDSDDD